MNAFHGFFELMLPGVGSHRQPSSKCPINETRITVVCVDGYYLLWVVNVISQPVEGTIHPGTIINVFPRSSST